MANEAGARSGRPHPRDLHAAAFAGALSAALAVLFWTCRGARLGAPVMDDYMFMHTLRFRPLDVFGPVALNPYWRPISRQVYYLLLGPSMVDHHWVPVVVHAGLFAALALLLYRITSPWIGSGAAIVVATFPLLSEPARVLLSWPSCAQPLLAMTFAALALHEALADRRWTAAAAGLAAALSYEQALLVFVPVAYVAWSRRGAGRRHVWVPAAAAALLLGAGEWIARGHGAGLFGPALAGDHEISPASQIAVSLAGQFSLLENTPVLRAVLAMGYVVVGAIAVIGGVSHGARARIARALPLILGGGAWFVAGTAALAIGSGALCAWRSMLPGLGLALALTAWLGAVSPWLPAALCAVRLAGLLMAPVVPPGVEGRPPETRLAESFIKISRLQRVVDSAREAVRGSGYSFPRGARIRYWSRPAMVGAGFARQEAIHVWLDDSTATWSWLDNLEQPHDLVLAFNAGVPSPAVVLRPEALEAYRLAMIAQQAGDAAREDSLVAAALALQRPAADAFSDELVRVASRLAFARGDLARADSLNRVSWNLGGESPDHDAMVAMLALRRGRFELARAPAQRCLALAPGNREASEVLRRLSAEEAVARDRAPDARAQP